MEDGFTAKQKTGAQARQASPARLPDHPAARGRAGQRRSASAPPHKSQRLLSRQEGRKDPGRGLAFYVLTRGYMRVTIAVDAMGGDHGPPGTVAASLRFLDETVAADIVLVGREDAVRAALGATRSPAFDRIRVQPTTEVVAMDELPADALRRKKDSSMRVAINLVKEGTAQACVSAGNTGALMAISRFV